MIVLKGDTGKIFYVIKDADYLTFQHTTHVPLAAVEIPDRTNGHLCDVLYKTEGKGYSFIGEELYKGGQKVTVNEDDSKKAIQTDGPNFAAEYEAIITGPLGNIPDIKDAIIKLAQIGKKIAEYNSNVVQVSEPPPPLKIKKEEAFVVNNPEVRKEK